MNPFVDSITEV